MHLHLDTVPKPFANKIKRYSDLIQRYNFQLNMCIDLYMG